jgi:hypothetical protein
MRALGIGPVPSALAARPTYQLSEIDEWICDASATTSDAVRASVTLQAVLADVELAVASHR